jgi:hypothetical protein
MSKTVALSDRVAREIEAEERILESQHWKRRLEVDFGKLGIEGEDEFLRLCAPRFMPVPRERRSDYRWLHYRRAEKLKEWSQEDHQAMLNADADAALAKRIAPKGKRSNASEMRRFRQRWWHAIWVLNSRSHSRLGPAMIACGWMSIARRRSSEFGQMAWRSWWLKWSPARKDRSSV